VPEFTVRAAYDRWAESYDEGRNGTRDLDAVVLRAQPFDYTGARVVEIGCGTGKNTAWLATKAAEVVALDFSPNMLRVARTQVPADHVTFVEHDITLPWLLPAGFADFIICDLVLEHVEDLRPVFRYVRTALRDGGTLFVCEFHPYRQLQGEQARFADGAETVVRVPAFLHDTADFVAAGLEAGLRLTDLSEWRDDNAPPRDSPRLLSLTFTS
jgi:ubiquinone/menaquinone biosynthesis C-methylase UbiE